jgi:hypothetical protein
MSTRKYKCSDVVMLVVLNSIAESFLACMAELSTIRLNWNAEYANQLKIRIANAVKDYLGLDPKKVLRNATIEVHAIQEPAVRDVAFLKSQLDVDFEQDKVALKEMLKTLGFGQYLTKIQKDNHEALIAFLQMFSNNITEDIKKSIVDKGTDPQLLDRIVGYSKPFTVAEMNQEALKTSTKELPANTITKLNELYTEAIGICKIAAKYYRGNPIKKEQFTFDAVLKKVKVQVMKASPDTPTGETK